MRAVCISQPHENSGHQIKTQPKTMARGIAELAVCVAFGLLTITMVYAPAVYSAMR